MSRRACAILVGMLLTATSLGTAVAHETDGQRHIHQLGDGIADTPKEMDQLQAELDEQHGPAAGHLPGSSLNVDLVGKVTVSGATGVDKPSHIADVTTLGNYAYLAARRLNTSPCGAGGFYTVNISNPSSPTEVGFTPFPPQSYPGEGMQALKLSTAFFTGDILVTNNENCTNTNPARVGGMSIYNITNPAAIVPLAIGKGDTNNGALPRANQIHSVFAWQAGTKAYAILVDNQEITDVDIMEITDPTNPVHIAEVSILNWPDAHSPLANGESVFLHDMVVKKIDGNWYALLSYWDAGWIILNVNDPANPVFVDDSNYPDPEPLLGFSPPEGNAHQAEWSSNNKFIIGTDEDFSPARTSFEITSGPNAGFYGAGQFSWTVPISASNPFVGSTVWAGSGCIADLNGNGVSDRADIPAQSTSGAAVAVFSRGSCNFSEKVESAQLAGYSKVIIYQSHAGTRNGLTPNGFTCGAQGHFGWTITASAICIGHRAGHFLFNDAPEYTPNECAAVPCSFPPGGDLPAIGTIGASVSATTTFDGWGTVQLLNADTLQTIDNYAVAEGIDPAYATGFGTLSVHEVATDPRAGINLAYLSYYDAGLRVIKFGKNGMEEVGHYVDAGGNDFWGVEVTQALNPRGKGAPLLLMSDRDSGLWIFRYTGD